MNSTEKKRILIFSEYYLPGYKSGGGMRTIVNIVSNLSDLYDFYIVTKDHDGKSDKTPYEDVKINQWNQIGNSKVFYLDRKNTNFSKILELFEEVNPDILYSNSYFSIFDIHLLVLNRLGKLNDIPYIISPCGELSKDSFKMGTFKKKTFIGFSNILRLHKNIIWKVSTEVEKKEFEEIMGKKNKVVIARDLISKTYTETPKFLTKPEKAKGLVKFVFLSRFNRKKNFKFLLENLFTVKGKVEIDVYGPIDDENYWNECLDTIKKLPENILVKYKTINPARTGNRDDEKLPFFYFTDQTRKFWTYFSGGIFCRLSDRHK